MPSPDSISADLPIDVFGGLVTQFDPQQLPRGASPFNQDIVYSGKNPTGVGRVAGVGTRPGLAPFYAAPFAGNPSVNYLAQFADNAGVIHLLSLDSLGVVRDESPCPAVPGVPTQIGQVVAACVAQSDSMIGQEWMAFSDVQHPAFGIDIPRHYDGTNFDRVSQVGPGEAPFAQDCVSSTTISPAAGLGLIPWENNTPGTVITAVTMLNRVVTVTVNNAIYGGVYLYKAGDIVEITGNPGGYNGLYTLLRIVSPTSVEILAPAATGLAPSAGGNYWSNIVIIVAAPDLPTPPPVGMSVTVAAATDPTYDGTWEVRQSAPPFYLVYLPGSSHISSDSGTITIVGNVTAGLHLVSVSFITRSQYITKPSPFASWTAAGGLGVLLTDIPVGPPNTIARLLIFTPVITPPAVFGNFYYLPNPVDTTTTIYPSTIIADNALTTGVFNFDDATLILGTLATQLFRLLELGECASVITYSGRTFWAGERNKIENFQNLSFDGGFDSGLVRPLGWYMDAAPAGFGGAIETADVVWGAAYKVTGNGAAVVRGRILQPAYKDFLGVPIFNPRTDYSVRVRLKKGGGIVVGNAVIDILSGGVAIGSFSTPVANISATGYTEFIGAILASANVIPLDITLRAYVDGTPTNNGFILFENIEVFPTKTPYNRPVIRASYAGDPESIDSLTGLILPSDASSESIRGMFTLLDNKLYIVSDTGIYVTQDDGANEPSRWAVNTVSARVGMESVLGVDVGESWAVIGHQDGAYIFWGGEPVKISQEIQPDWDTINWAYSQKMYMLVDNVGQRVIIGIPSGETTHCNKELVMDYSQLGSSESVSAQEIAAAPQAFYNGNSVVASGKARKWTTWNITANCIALVERTSGNTLILRGNGSGNGKVYNQLETQLSDDGVAINSQYQFYFAPQSEEEDRLGTHRKLCKYMTGYCFGVGTMTFTMEGAQNQRPLTLSSLPLQNPCPADFEKNVNFVAERMSLLVGTNAVGSWFQMSKLSLSLQKDLVSPVRGNIL